MGTAAVVRLIICTVAPMAGTVGTQSLVLWCHTKCELNLESQKFASIPERDGGHNSEAISYAYIARPKRFPITPMAAR